VRAENDWTSEQVARFPERLRGFCGFNPLRDYALRELARCAQEPESALRDQNCTSATPMSDLDNRNHIDRVRHIFREANRHSMAMVVHMRSSVTREPPYGARQAPVFLTKLLTEAPSVSVQIAHLCSGGGYDDPAIDQALEVFVDAIAKHDQRMAHVFFDISGITGTARWRERSELITTRIRQLGLDRVLFGSDGAFAGTRPASIGRASDNCHSQLRSSQQLSAMSRSI
jgi:predicted TIM-barrel fold metal-dependent hydrolase